MPGSLVGCDAKKRRVPDPYPELSLLPRATYAGPASPRRWSLLAPVAVFIRRSPARAAILVFLLAAGVFAGLLKLPLATESGTAASWPDAVFTATSAMTVTGLTSVDTATFWSPFGHVVILLTIQTGGLGIVTVALLLHPQQQTVARTSAHRQGHHAAPLLPSRERRAEGADERDACTAKSANESAKQPVGRGIAVELSTGHMP